MWIVCFVSMGSSFRMRRMFCRSSAQEAVWLRKLSASRYFRASLQSSMVLFKRGNDSSRSNDDQDSSEVKKDKAGWKRPANTAFKQQRLKAWQPILTPRTVLPTLFIIGILFGPIGTILLLGSSKVSQITIPYTGCEKASTDFSEAPGWSYSLRASDAKLPFAKPQWASANNGQTCRLRFELPADLPAPVFQYYKLTNFYQNHRRYVRSIDSGQLKGQKRSKKDLDNSDCKPLGSIGDKPIYPCGLIANSIFNDTIGNATLLGADGSVTGTTYNFTAKGIAWPGEAKKYTDKPDYDPSEIVPPPNWSSLNGTYTAETIPKLASDERFQNWMRTSGLPTFTKLYGRNDGAAMAKGTYEMAITLAFPVAQFGGTKSIVISTTSWIGGKNPFLGWAYVATAGVFVLLAIAGTVRHCVKPRKLGDMSLLSWNQPAARR